MEQVKIGRRELVMGAALAGAAAVTMPQVKIAKAEGADDAKVIMGYATPVDPFEDTDEYTTPKPLMCDPSEDKRAIPNEECIAKYFPAPSGLLDGKVAIVTGASSGFGREIARAYAREGANVVAVARREERLQALAEESAAYPGTIAGFVADLSDRGQTHQIVEFAHETFGPVDIIVNNAGSVGGYQSLGTLMEPAWDYLMELNVNAAMFATQDCIPDMLEKNEGAIINIASVGGVAGYFGVDYHTTKAALIAMTHQTAFRYSGETGIRCNAILPGGFDTEIGNSIQYLDEATKTKCGDQGAKYITYGDPEEIAALALFLASDAAKNINGAEIKSDGGWTA